MMMSSQCENMDEKTYGRKEDSLGIENSPAAVEELSTKYVNQLFQKVGVIEDDTPSTSQVTE